MGWQHSDWLWLASLIALVAISGFFSSSETAMMAVNRYRLKYLAKRGNRLAKLVLTLLNRPDRLLGVILIGNTFANILASSIATVLAVKIFGEFSIVISTVALTLVVLIFAEMAPKTLAAVYAKRVAFFVVLPLSFLLYVLYPVVWLVNLAANSLLRLCRVNVKQLPSDVLSREELRNVVYEAGSHIPQEHHRMLLSIFDLEHVSIEHIMVPRNQITGIDITEDWDDILYQLTNSQHTRLPVYAEDITHLKGLLHVRMALNLLANDELNKDTMLAHLEEVLYVPESTPLNVQLLNFRKEKKRIGFVVDEYGELLGLVTLEDILEEIVGEFTTDWAATSSQEIHPQADGSYLIDGSITLRELNRLLSWQLPSDGPKTLSGLIIEYLAEIPETAIGLCIAGYAVEVIQVKDNTIKTARIYPRPALEAQRLQD